MGKKLHQKENLRCFYSFLLALGVHLLLLLCNWGRWGVQAEQLRIIPVYSRLIAVEEKPVVSQTPATERKNPPVERKETPPKKEVEAKAEMAEVVQEQPAPRQVPPVEREEPPSPADMPLEPDEDPTHEQELLNENSEQTPEEEGKDEAPPLPPLGNGRGMVASYMMTYHKDLLHEGVEGRVRLEIFLTADGDLLTEPVILRSSGHDRLDEHCLMSVKRNWHFEPAARPYRLIIEVSFSKNEPRPIIDFLGDAVYFSPEGGDFE